jgi:hypothetical protein
MRCVPVHVNRPDRRGRRPYVRRIRSFGRRRRRSRAGPARPGKDESDLVGAALGGAP